MPSQRHRPSCQPGPPHTQFAGVCALAQGVVGSTESLVKVSQEQLEVAVAPG